MKYTLSKGLNNSPDARAIRQSVFVEEQGFEYEFDDIDETALHLVLYDENDNPCATGRLFFNGCMKIGRIAVMKEYRGQSLGSEVIAILEEKALESGAHLSSFPLKYRQKIFIKNSVTPKSAKYIKKNFVRI